MIHAVIFDFDGVILESVEVKGEAFLHLFANRPDLHKKIMAYHLEHGGVPRDQKIRHILSDFLGETPDPEKINIYSRKFSEYVFERVVGSPFVKGARETLDALYGHVRMYIVSGTPHEEMNRIVEALHIAKYFHQVCGSPTGKIEWTGKIANNAGITTQQILWVGDALSDYEAASAFGIRFVLRSWVGNKHVFYNRDVRHTIDDLTGLPALIEKLNRER